MLSEALDSCLYYCFAASGTVELELLYCQRFKLYHFLHKSYCDEVIRINKLIFFYNLQHDNDKAYLPDTRTNVLDGCTERIISLLGFIIYV